MKSIVRVFRITAVVVALLLVGGAVPLAAATSGVTVDLDTPAAVGPDSNFTVNINISQVTNFDSCNYDITFDASVLRLDYVASGLIGSTTVPVDMYNELSSGTYRVVQNVPGVAGVSGFGYLAVLYFHVVGADGDSSAITLSNGVLSDNQTGEITATWTGVTVDITSVVAGDGNGNGAVNALDITKVVERVIVGLDTETHGSDANGDGNINAMDITMIELIIAGMAQPVRLERNTSACARIKNLPSARRGVGY